MKFDVFFSICQTEVNGYLPNERTMLHNFFDCVCHADKLGYKIAWVAESHLSCEVQKQNFGAVIPNFKGEIGLNSDTLHLAHRIFAKTKHIHVGSACRSLLVNGGPIAHAEAVKMFLTLHELEPTEERLFYLGFASGRFPFSIAPYGIIPRSAVEKVCWTLIRRLIFREATEIFLRFLRGDIISSHDIKPKIIRREDFGSDLEWETVLQAYGKQVKQIEIPPFWIFDRTGVIPSQVSLKSLKLLIGSHDPVIQEFANTILPCGVLNLSITPKDQIEDTHRRMQTKFHSDGGEWKRCYMPRTVLVFINTSNSVAHERAYQALQAYWQAMEGTLDSEKVSKAVNNALVGTPEDIIQQIQERFHLEDRLMLWFDFFNHNNEEIKQSMTLFIEDVAPKFT
jgi:alkanesulfonate monooxygenase SsuD/methylene tetrahydromethanopterin reductase-like flavin-dependent oxidoreductase (luciferase family)